MKLDHAFGIPIITNPYLTESKVVPRSWKERLFSWPWRPLVKTKTIQVPDDKVYLINTPGAYFELDLGGRGNAARCYVCHPLTIPKLKKALEDAAKEKDK
jgi:hypothetical protein